MSNCIEKIYTCIRKLQQNWKHRKENWKQKKRPGNLAFKKSNIFRNWKEKKRKEKRKKKERNNLYTGKLCTLHKKEKEEEETFPKNRTVIIEHFFWPFFFTWFCCERFFFLVGHFVLTIAFWLIHLGEFFSLQPLRNLEEMYVKCCYVCLRYFLAKCCWKIKEREERRCRKVFIWRFLMAAWNKGLRLCCKSHRKERRK